MIYTISTAFAIYFVIWWIVLFLTLPFGVRSQHEDGEGGVPGTDPGAPIASRMGRKLIWTTLIRRCSSPPRGWPMMPAISTSTAVADGDAV